MSDQDQNQTSRSSRPQTDLVAVSELAARRLAVGIPRSEMARRLGYSPPYLLEIERGTRRLTPEIMNGYLREIEREIAKNES